jgi:hypothetical protein
MAGLYRKRNRAPEVETNATEYCSHFTAKRQNDKISIREEHFDRETSLDQNLIITYKVVLG